jgi:hypothetical protein
MSRERAERSAFGQEDRKVKKTERAPASRRDAGSGPKVEQRMFRAMRPEHRVLSSRGVQPQTNHVLVVGDGPLQIADLQVHATDVRRVGQPEGGWRNAIRAID